MFVIRNIVSGKFITQKVKDNFYSKIYFKTPEEAFDFIRFETPCCSKDYSYFGVVLVPCSYFFEEHLSEYSFHFGLGRYFLDNPKDFNIYGGYIEK